MAKVIALKAKTVKTAVPEHLAAKAALLRLAISGLRGDVPASKFTAVEMLAYEVECLITDGRLPWDAEVAR